MGDLAPFGAAISASIALVLGIMTATNPYMDITKVYTFMGTVFFAIIAVILWLTWTTIVKGKPGSTKAEDDWRRSDFR